MRQGFPLNQELDWQKASHSDPPASDPSQSWGSSCVWSHTQLLQWCWQSLLLSSRSTGTYETVSLCPESSTQRHTFFIQQGTTCIPVTDLVSAKEECLEEEVNGAGLLGKDHVSTQCLSWCVCLHVKYSSWVVLNSSALPPLDLYAPKYRIDLYLESFLSFYLYVSPGDWTYVTGLVQQAPLYTEPSCHPTWQFLGSSAPYHSVLPFGEESVPHSQWWNLWSKLLTLPDAQFSHLGKETISAISTVFEVRNQDGVCSHAWGLQTCISDRHGYHGEMTLAEQQWAVVATEVLALKQNGSHFVSFCQTTIAYTVGDGCSEQSPSVPIQVEGWGLSILNHLVFISLLE